MKAIALIVTNLRSIDVIPSPLGEHVRKHQTLCQRRNRRRVRLFGGL
jgi:hypothetical protein